MVETWQPSPFVRNSKRSGPVAQMNLCAKGERRGKVAEKGSRGRGRQVEDWVGVLDVGAE